MLSIPMIFEMIMELLFAVVDIYWVGKISTNAVATVALTESVIMIVYAVAIGLSMAATAMVARRVGEKKDKEASVAAVQVLALALGISLVISIIGLLFPKEILGMMGGEAGLIEEGYRYTCLLYTSPSPRD